ncbi:MAG: acyltransferase [Clostridia bacterium]|nr:acyltransferase [Clostridia bacterium]
MEREKKHRLFLIDLMRIVCAFLIYARHSITMYGCTYGHHALDVIFTLSTSPVMTCFFVLSGFSIHYQHRNEELTGNWVKTFLLKRMITIMPCYLLVVLIWPLVYPAQAGNWLALLPVDLFGVQTAYRSLFGILHNGGTWFVSCILMAYVLYPVMKAVLNQDRKRRVCVALVILHFLLIYSNYIIPRFSLDGLYSNPLARSAEFMTGAAFSEIVFTDRKAVSDKSGHGGVLPAAVVIVCLTVISLLIAKLNGAGVRDTVQGYLILPAVLLCLLASAFLRFPLLERSKILALLSGMSYPFFLTQCFLWDLTSRVLGLLGLGGNTAKLGVSFITCFVISFVVFRFYDKPVRKFLLKKI